MKRFIAVLLAILLCLTAFAGCAQTDAEPENTAAAGGDTADVSEKELSEEQFEVSVAPESSAEEVPVTTEPAVYNVASLKGPTTMGMVKLMQDAEANETFNTYNVTMYGAADEISAGIANGTIDIANVPCNLAAVLYNKTQGAISVAAVNTLGVLYVVETGETIQSFEDLKGKTIYSTGKGTTPEFALNYLLTENGMDPSKDVTIEYKSEATEVAAMLAQSENAVAVLPQPFVTTAMMQNEKLRIALSFTEEWDSLQGNNGSTVVTGVTIVRNEVLNANPQAFSEFMKEYEASIAYTASNPNETAALIANYGIVPKEPVALKALPYCNLSFIQGEKMKDMVSGYLEVLYDADPKSVGGTLPDDAFYYSE